MANKTLFALMFLCSYALLRRRHLYNCRESSTNQLFFNKQSQFRESLNERKYLLYKDLSKFYPAGGAKKQTQFKPNQTQSQKSQNERKIGCIHISKKYNVLIRKVLANQTYFVVKNELY